MQSNLIIEKESAMEMQHAGTELSLKVEGKGEYPKFLKITHTNGEVVVAKFSDKKSVHLFCPSVEGTVIWCKMKSGEELFIDSKTGKQLSAEELMKMNVSLYN